ncbi:MAG: branched-chain amino acid ABC transporter permease [Pseudomonadota bacterium]|nr:branched-chain amino acid ABC transporter permease [Pseudomonadota bacterium]
MFAEFLQFLATGITIGATYALVALGFSIIYNASHVINFAQGEFLMLGGMSTVYLTGLGLPLPLAILLGVALTTLAGLALEKFAIEPAKNADIVQLIIITIGASIFLRGVAQLLWGKEFHALPAFSGETPIKIGGAAIQPQSLWVLGVTLVIVVLLQLFFTRTRLGKSILGTAYNRLAAKLVGINTRFVLLISFGLSAMLGAIAGIIIAPITFTSYDIGIMLGLKGFVAAVLGGLGSGTGAIVGGLILGIAEAMTAGYISSEYKDVVPFVLILFILFFLPNGLFGVRDTERV